MHLTQALPASEIQSFFFDWYPVFGVFFMFGLLLVFLKLLRGTMGTTKPETVKASKTEPVLWEEVQGVDAAKDELMDVAEWLRDPDRFAALGAQPPRGVLLFGPPGNGQDDAGARRRRAGRRRLLLGLGLELRRDVRRAGARRGSGGCSRRRASPGAR